MKQNEEKVIMFYSPEAAKKVNIDLWQSIDGTYHLTEDGARYTSCTHNYCGCGAAKKKGYIKCDSCLSEDSRERYLALPFEEWDGVVPVCTSDSDTYFFNIEDIENYMEDDDMTEIDLLICEPNQWSQIGSSYWDDDMPENGELPEVLKDALKVVNDVISKLPPICWYPGKIRTSYKKEEEIIDKSSIEVLNGNFAKSMLPAGVLRVLVACEESQAVTKAFRKLGHNAFSCDLLPESGGHPEWHLQKDIFEVLNDNWDMIIAFPPCTHLAVSGTKYFAQKIADGRQQQGIDFFMLFANHPCKKIAIENPVGIMSSKWRKPDQIIQPFEYGHPESKKTCLWLKGLPKLKSTNILEKPECGYWNNQTPEGQNKIIVDGKWIGFNDKRTPHLRSKTYDGIAEAMATQWSSYACR